MIDYRLLDQWQRDLTARQEMRPSLPASRRDDPHPMVTDMVEAFVDGMLQTQPSSNVVAIRDDDR